jgi:hypothetical protein
VSKSAKVVLALLWQIFSGTGFPNQFFNDSWVVGFWRAVARSYRKARAVPRPIATGSDEGDGGLWIIGTDMVPK